jgi:hypothetical protein
MQRRDEADRVATRAVETGRAPAARPSPWSTAAWVAVPVIAGAAQVLRGAWDDALIFLVPAAVLVADAVGLLPRSRATAVRLRRLLPAAVVVAGGVLALTPRHGLLDALAVTVLGVLVLGSAWPEPPPVPRPPIRRRSAVLWACAVLALTAWELVNFVLGFGSDLATAAHPVISDLLDQVADVPAGRLLLAAAWVAAGLALLRRGGRR